MIDDKYKMCRIIINGKSAEVHFKHELAIDNGWYEQTNDWQTERLNEYGMHCEEQQIANFVSIHWRCANIAATGSGNTNRMNEVVLKFTKLGSVTVLPKVCKCICVLIGTTATLTIHYSSKLISLFGTHTNTHSREHRYSEYRSTERELAKHKFKQN